MLNIQNSIKNELTTYAKLKKEFNIQRKKDLLNEVYIINKKWFKKWKKYAKSIYVSKNNISSKEKKFFTENYNIHPGKINNSDIVYDLKEFINSNLGGKVEYIIKNNKKDQIKLVSKKIWDFLISIYKGGPEIKRECLIQKNENNEETNYFDLYYKHFNLLFAIKYDDEVNIKSIISKDPFKIFISNFKTVLEFKDIIMNSLLTIYEINLKDAKIYKRLWKVNKIYKDNLKELKKVMIEKKEIIDKSISVEFPGVLLDQVPNILLCENETAEMDTLIFEVVIQQNLNEINPIFKVEANINEDTCGNCKAKTLLFYCCMCRKVWYCSENCFFLNEKVHKPMCNILMNSSDKTKAEDFKLEYSITSLLGVVGLKNLGNTCYMNTALQCLSNCYELSYYFLCNKFIESINKDNPLGYKGLIAFNYAKLIKGMWYGNNKCISPAEFKKTISNFHLKFSGYQQQDSQEFLIVLLDALHEDLNKVKSKHYISDVNTKNKSEENISEEAWVYHLMRNQSVLVDLFFAQFKSSLICRSCNEVSLKFEPYMTISLPIPNQEFIEIHVNFVFYELKKGIFKLIVLIERDGKVYNLRKKLSKMLNIPLNSYIICNLFNQRIDRIYNNLTLLQKMSQQIFTFQIDQKLIDLNNRNLKTSTNNEVDHTLNESHINIENIEVNNPEYFEKKSAENSSNFYSQLDNSINDYMLTTKINPDKQVVETTNNLPTSLEIFSDNNYGFCKNFIKIFLKIKTYEGAKLMKRGQISFERIIYLKKTWTLAYVHLYIFIYIKDLLENMSDYSHIKGLEDRNAFSIVFNSEFKKLSNESDNMLNQIQNNFPYIIRVKNISSVFSPKNCILCERKNCPDCILPYSDVIILSQILEKYKRKDSFLNLDNNYLYFDPLQKKLAIPRQDFELELSFLSKHKNSLKNYFFQAKIPKIKTKQIDIINNKVEKVSIKDCFSKFIQIESLDEKNEWFCPNCKSLQKAKKKIEIWNTPPILIIHLKRFKNNHKLLNFIDFPVTDFDLKNYILNKDNACNKYDLFAVCNHYGSPDFGHYTAFAKNYINLKWYCFDDNTIRELDEKEIVNQNAYVLFYRRKDLVNKQFDLDQIFDKIYVNHKLILKDNFLKIT